MRLAEILFLVVWLAFWVGVAVVAIIWIYEVAEVEQEKASSIAALVTAFYSK